MRIGQGFDVHRLEEGHKVILCGIEIPHEKGLVGWSDADCAVHALMDALLGACGLPDIGHLFPPGDERYRGVSSLTLLEYVMRRVNAGGYRICNCDITIMAERPKISPYIDEMKKKLAPILELRSDAIGIKATTTEKLGFCGREEGIAASAVVLLTEV
jgi:2-C-methyl-D-erythritol 2,4-cyclodiphosphate synthase